MSMGQRNELTVTKKKVAPPKPPRPAEGWGYEDSEGVGEGRSEATNEETEDLNLERRMTGMEAVNDRQLSSHADHHPPTPHPSDPPIPPNYFKSCPSVPPTTGHSEESCKRSMMRRRSKSSESMMERIRRLPSISSVSSNSSVSKDKEGKQDVRQKVSSLIEMFESKSPNSSPKRTRRWGESATARDEDVQGDFPELENVDSETSRSLSQSNVPIPPPKPRVVIPPIPPRPLSTDLGDKGAPVIPPRTPAPLLPPKPPGSMPPSIAPRYTHRRSRSYSNPQIEPDPPSLPPK